jgi:hypothetical protein
MTWNKMGIAGQAGNVRTVMLLIAGTIEMFCNVMCVKIAGAVSKTVGNSLRGIGTATRLRSVEDSTANRTSNLYTAMTLESGHLIPQSLTTT